VQGGDAWTPAGETRRERRRRRSRRRLVGLIAACVVFTACAAVGVAAVNNDEAGSARASGRAAGSDDGTPITPTPSITTTTAPPFDGWVDPASVYQPYAGATVQGLLTFRGNPTRNYYGKGPVPRAPIVAWSYPDRAMCSPSEDGGETTTWCGNGWTGQPAVFERDGRTLVAFGAYDRAVHLVDAATGVDVLPPFVTGDIIKGSVTVDPEGYPLIYVGSRDNKFRILAFDRLQLTELWSLDAYAVQPTLWNDDWDSSALVVKDWLFEGGENSQVHAVKLNRGYGPDGLATVAPELVWHAPGWDDEQLRDFGNDVSIENSVALYGNTLYFGNSGGLVQGWDVLPLLTGTGEPQRVFRFWAGDDTDGTITVDEHGILYVGAEWERHLPRSAEVGQMLALDPSRDDGAALVWSQHDNGVDQAGVYSSAGISGDLVIFTTYSGRAVGLDRATGAIRWEKHLPGPLMGSPVIVDGVWLQGDCAGVLHAFDVHDTMVDPPELWSVGLGGCIEATPAVWNGRIYIGTRAGFEYALADA
jgi:PQQ-like domain